MANILGKKIASHCPWDFSHADSGRIATKKYIFIKNKHAITTAGLHLQQHALSNKQRKMMYIMRNLTWILIIAVGLLELVKGRYTVILCAVYDLILFR